MKKFTLYSLLALAFIPLVSFSNVFVPAVNGKVFVYRLIVFIVTTALCVTVLKNTEEATSLLESLKKVTRTPLFIAITLLTVALLISTVFAYNPYVAFFGEWDRGEGFITLFSLYALYVFTAVVFERKEYSQFFTLSAYAMIIVFLYQVIQSLEGVSRASSLLANPLFLSGMYVFNMFCGLYLCSQTTYPSGKTTHKKPVSVLGIITVVISIVGIFLTQTRGTIVGVIVALFICSIIIQFLKIQDSIGSYPLKAVGRWVSIGVVVCALIFVTTRNAQLWRSIPGLDRLANTTAENSGSRLVFLNITKDIFLESTPTQKIVGWGWDNYRYAWAQYYEPKAYLYDTAFADRAHNKLADMLIMQGIIGLFTYLAVVFLFFKKAVYVLKQHAMLGISVLFFGISYFVHNMFAFDTPVILYSFYIVVAYMQQYKTTA